MKIHIPCINVQLHRFSTCFVLLQYW